MALNRPVQLLLGGNHQLLALDQLMVRQEIAVDLLAAVSNTGYFFASILFQNRQGPVI